MEQKNLQKILMKIELEKGTLRQIEEFSWKEERKGELKEVFRDAKLLVDVCFIKSGKISKNRLNINILYFFCLRL